MIHITDDLNTPIHYFIKFNTYLLTIKAIATNLTGDIKRSQ
ncbi:hypothetical protein [Nostoc sp.]